jgi:predicted transcriptional regulator
MRPLQRAEDTLKKGLSAAEALKVGETKVDLGLLADYKAGKAVIGGFVDAEKKITKSIAGYARAEAGRILQTGKDENFALGTVGLRFRW